MKTEEDDEEDEVKRFGGGKMGLVSGREGVLIMDVIMITVLGLDFERISTASRPPFLCKEMGNKGLGF